MDIFNMLVTMLPGTSVTYYGEEIGMEDSCVVYNADHNLPGRRCAPSENTNSDSRYRTPMQWDDTKNGGFSTADLPWLPIGDKYRQVNVAAQQDKAGTHLEIYKALQNFRHTHDAMKSSLDGFKMVELSKNSFAFKRELTSKEEESVLVLINYGDSAETVKVQEKLIGLPDNVRVKIVGEKSSFKINQELNIAENFTLPAYESIVAVYNEGISLIFSRILGAAIAAYWVMKIV